MHGCYEHWNSHGRDHFCARPQGYEYQCTYGRRRAVDLISAHTATSSRPHTVSIDAPWLLRALELAWLLRAPVHTRRRAVDLIRLRASDLTRFRSMRRIIYGFEHWRRDRKPQNSEQHIRIHQSTAARAPNSSLQSERSYFLYRTYIQGLTPACLFRLSVARVRLKT